MSDANARIIVIIGMMGTGKTTVGRRVADLLDLPFRDNDDLIATAASRPAADLLRADAAAFRQQELESIRETLHGNVNCVLATGGGAVATPAVADLLRAHSPVIWLQLDQSLIAARIRDEASARPMLDGDFEERLQQLMVERMPLYESVADVIIDASGSPDTVAKAIVDAVGAVA